MTDFDVTRTHGMGRDCLKVFDCNKGITFGEKNLQQKISSFYLSEHMIDDVISSMTSLSRDRRVAYESYLFVCAGNRLKHLRIDDRLFRFGLFYKRSFEAGFGEHIRP